MDTVLPAFVSIFIMLFGVLTLTNTLFSTQNTVSAASQVMQARLDERARTSLIPVSGSITNAGANIQLVYRNQGVTRLTDFSQWDVVVQYMDGSAPSGYHIDWRAYTIGVPYTSTWAVSGIYLNAAKALSEAFDPGILDPGEELSIQLKFSPPVGNGKVALVTLSTGNGVTASSQVRRNMPPVLMTNIGATTSISAPVIITTAKLNVTDVDNAPDTLVYSITTAPTKGTLNLGTTALIVGATFTQADINNGHLNYAPISAGSDNFQFTVTNGDSTIGPDSFGLVTTNP
jgi:hypothetical protein